MSFLTIETPVAALPLPFDAVGDLETSITIAKLALEDINQVMNSQKGRRRADSSPLQEEMAYQVQKEELTQWLTFVEDLKFVQSLEKAVATDHAYLEAFSAAEAAESEDRHAAELLSHGQQLPPPSALQRRLEDPAFLYEPEVTEVGTLGGAGGQKQFAQIPQELEVTSIFDAKDEPDHDDQSEAEWMRDIDQDKQFLLQKKVFAKGIVSVQSSDAGPSGVRRDDSIECTACGEALKTEECLHLPGNHAQCRECIQRLIELFTRDESLYPLQYCGMPIPLEHVFAFISPSLRKTFEEKNAEYSVLAMDRVYCVNPSCSSFLGPGEGKSPRVGIICPTCQTSTFPSCKQAAHLGDDCSENEAAEQVRALARQEGWQTCPGCHIIIELNHGCYHMRYRMCRSEFCYLCAVQWKNCTCAQWDEDRLLVTAQRRIENEYGAEAAARMAPAVLQQRVQSRARRLQVVHDCSRGHKWRYRRGDGMCEECGRYCPQFLLICRTCQLGACGTCVKHRL